jgi:hypothetical protein
VLPPGGHRVNSTGERVSRWLASFWPTLVGSVIGSGVRMSVQKEHPPEDRRHLVLKSSLIGIEDHSEATPLERARISGLKRLALTRVEYPGVGLAIPIANSGSAGSFAF